MALNNQTLCKSTLTVVVVAVTGPAPEVVTRRQGKWADSGLADRSQAVFDVVVCGGTLGVFLATALALRGLKVAIIERGPLRGRVQDWNVSRKELKELVYAGVLTEDEIEEVISIEFNPSWFCGRNGALGE